MRLKSSLVNKMQINIHISHYSINPRPPHYQYVLLKITRHWSLCFIHQVAIVNTLTTDLCCVFSFLNKCFSQFMSGVPPNTTFYESLSLPHPFMGVASDITLNVDVGRSDVTWVVLDVHRRMQRDLIGHAAHVLKRLPPGCWLQYRS